MVAQPDYPASSLSLSARYQSTVLHLPRSPLYTAAMQPFTPEPHHDGVRRLTLKERECLERWLGHATAKEIAIDLGISHHAVEKRLKSARQKLGVSSTLEAARCLATAEGYGQTASQPSEVPGAAASVQAPFTTTATAHRGPGRLIAGVSIMSIAIITAAAFAVTAGQAPQPASQATAAGGRTVIAINRKDGQSVNLADVLANAFATMDRNRDRYLAGDELNNSAFQVRRVRIEPGAPSGPVVTTLAQFDTNGDKRVSEAEFRTGMAGLTARQGTPRS